MPIYKTTNLPQPEKMQLTSEKDIPAHLRVAEQYLKAGEFHNVVYICERVLQMKPELIEARAHLAAAYQGLGELEKFNRQLIYIKKQAPDSPDLYLSLAYMYAASGEINKIENTYKQGLLSAENDTELRMGLAGFYLEQERNMEAVEQYHIVLKKKGLAAKYFLNANFSLCRIDLQEKKYEQLAKRARMLIDLYPPMPQSYLFLAKAALGIGDINQAIKTYKKLLANNPQLVISYQELALIYSDKVIDYDQARYYAFQAVEKFPDDARSRDVLGWIYFQEKNYSDALKQFQSAVKRLKNPEYFYHLGLAQLKMENKLKAKESFEQALRLVDAKKSAKFAKELKRRIKQCS